LTAFDLVVILYTMSRRVDKIAKHNRPPRIRVPNQERAIFTVDSEKFLGTIQRLSLTGGSVLFAKGSLPEGTAGEMTLGTVFGRVNAHIEFLQTGADGVALAQAFRFLAMDDLSTRRFNAAAEKMQSAGFADAEKKATPSTIARGSWTKLRERVHKISGILTSATPKRNL
jgi:hypothetical protein